MVLSFNMFCQGSLLLLKSCNIKIIMFIRPFVNLGIGIGIGTDTINNIISSFIRLMENKPSRVVIYDEGTPPKKSRDSSMSSSRDK